MFQNDNTPETVDPSELRAAVESLEKYTGGFGEVRNKHPHRLGICAVLSRSPWAHEFG